MLTPTTATRSEYTSAIRNGSPTHVRITFIDQNIVLDDQDIRLDSGITINDVLNGETDLTFGKAVMKQFSTVFINSSRLQGIQWTSEFKLEMGVEISGSTDWVTIGYFRGEKPNNVTTASIIEFTAYDRMQLFDRPVISYVENISYPAKVKDIFHGLCDFVGIGYATGDELENTFERNYSTANSYPYVDMTNYTCRQLLGMLAEACGCYARIDSSGKCKMVWFSDHTSDYSLTEDDEFYSESADIVDGMTWDEFDQYTWNQADTMQWNYITGYAEAYAIDYLMVKQVWGFINYYPGNNGGNVYQINENPYLSIDGVIGQDPTAEIQTELYLKPIYDRLYAFGGHVPMKVESVGDWLVESGDIITVQIGEDTISAPVYIRTLRWNGFCQDEYETTGNASREYVPERTVKSITRNDVTNEIEIYMSTEDSSSDLNELTDSGSYCVNPSENGHSPSDLSSYDEDCMLIVDVFSSGIMQTLQTGTALYTRRYDGSSWGSWYKFDGTVVE